MNINEQASHCTLRCMEVHQSVSAVQGSLTHLLVTEGNDDPTSAGSHAPNRRDSHTNVNLCFSPPRRWDGCQADVMWLLWGLSAVSTSNSDA